LVGWLVDRLIGWLVGWLIDWLIDWLVGFVVLADFSTIFLLNRFLEVDEKNKEVSTSRL
jgi:hypothetical protein